MGKPDEDLSLPKATIAKLIKEILPDEMKCANETRDLLLDCCVGAENAGVSKFPGSDLQHPEFIHLVSSEASDICAKTNKKTIAPEHVIAALGVRARTLAASGNADGREQELGFQQYADEVQQVYETYKSETADKPRSSKKLEDLGISQEDLLQAQTMLFAQAKLAATPTSATPAAPMPPPRALPDTR